MSEDVKATIWVATHRLGQMRCLLMHEKHKAWKREFGFDRIETAAEMDEKRSRTSTSPVPNPFFYRNMVIPRHPHTPDEFTLEMKVDVEGLRMEIIPCNPRRHSVIHRRDAPRSIRGQRNPERRRNRPPSVRGRGLGHRVPKRKWRKKFSPLKPVWVVFCVQFSQAWSRSVFCDNQTSG